MLIDLVRSGRTGKYLALRQGVRTLLRSVPTSWPRAKYFPVRPSHSVNKYILRYIDTALYWTEFTNIKIFNNTIPVSTGSIQGLEVYTPCKEEMPFIM